MIYCFLFTYDFINECKIIVMKIKLHLTQIFKNCENNKSVTYKISLNDFPT